MFPADLISSVGLGVGPNLVVGRDVGGGAGANDTGSHRPVTVTS